MGPTRELSSPPSLDMLLSGGPVALFLDFDGTLIELAPTPDSIQIPPHLPSSLMRLQTRLTGRLALVSGRSLEDVEQHLGALNIARAGSHGAARKLADGAWLGEEPTGIGEEATARLAEFAAAEGIDLERKTHGAALHFRSAPAKEARATGFASTMAHEYGLAIKTGKCVVELVRRGADKGGAVMAFMQHEPFAGSRPIFIGDDITDEDGFVAADTLGGVGILVGEPRETSARHRLENVKDVHEWLNL